MAVLGLPASMSDRQYRMSIRQDATGRIQQVPVLGLTANVNPLDLERFKSAGLSGVMLKPFDPADLCHRVETLLLPMGDAA